MPIPHVMNFYWGSKTKISYLRYLSLATFRYHHPDWTINLYQSDWKKMDLGWSFGEFTSFVRQHDFIKEAKSILGVNLKTYEPDDKRVYKMAPANISDIFSYEMLYKHGGWYSDMDSICVKEFNRLSDADYSFVGFGGLKPWIGLFGAVQGSWVMKSFIEPCISAFDKNEYNSTGTFGIRRLLTDNAWESKFKEPDNGLRNYRAPEEMFYPLFVNETRKLWGNTEWTPSKSQTYAVHLYGSNEDYQLASMKMCPYWIRQGAHQDWITRYIRSLNEQRLFCLDADWGLSISLDSNNKPVVVLDYDGNITRPGTAEEYKDMTGKIIEEELESKGKKNWKLKEVESI